MINETTPHLGLQLPHPSNQLDEDVLRLRSAIGVIDGKFQALDALLASNDASMNTVQELVDAIKADALDLVDHVGSFGDSHASATTTTAGFMPATDKAKLDGVTLGALFASETASVPADGGTTLTLTEPYTAGSVMVFKNRQKLFPSEFTASGGTSITLAAGALAADVFEVVRFKQALSA